MPPLPSLAKKTALKSKLRIKGTGAVGNNAPASREIVTNNATFLYVNTLGRTGSISEAAVGTEVSVNYGGADAANAYVLPWETGKAARTDLGSAHPQFVTPLLNGCGVIICGTQANPVVVHANTKAAILDEGEPEYGPRWDTWRVNYKVPMWDSLYTVLASKLLGTGLLPDENTRLFLPGEYAEEGPGGVSVFGLNDGGWSFYAVFNRTADSVTKKIWPE